MKRKKKAPEPLVAAQSPAGQLRIPENAALLLVSAWALFVVFVYARAGVRLSIQDWIGFFSVASRLPELLGGGLLWDLAHAAGVWFLFYSVGAAVLNALKASPATRPESFVIAASLGAGTVSLILLFLGVLGFFSPVVLRAAFYGAVLACGAALWLGKNARAFEPLEKNTGRGFWEWAALLLAGAAVLMGVIGTKTPEIFYDSLVYHLALPKLYLLRGAIVPTPENIYSGLPLGMQLHYALGLSLSNEDLPALLHASFGVATAFGAWAWGRRWAGDSVGILAAFLFTLTPIGLYASWYAGVDLGSSFFIIAALLAASRGVQNNGGKLGLEPWSAVLGLLIGFAFGTKFNAVPIGGAFVLAYAYYSRGAGRPIRDSVWLALLAAAASSPWLIKNFIFYGNPLYPFLFDKIGWAAPADWKPFLEAAGARDLKALLSTAAGWKQFLLHPWSMSTGSWPLGDWPGPAYIVLTPWLALSAWRSGDEKSPPRVWALVFVLAGAGYLSWCAASKLVRYLLPVFPLIALATALGVERGGFSRRQRNLGWALALLSGLFGFQAAFRQAWGIGMWDFIEGKISRYDFLTRQRVTYGLPYYAAMRFIDQNLPQEAKVLFLGESRGYYCERDFVAATVYDHNPFWIAAGKAKSGAEIREWLRAQKITHVFMSARQLHFRADAPSVLPREVAASDPFIEFWATGLKRLWEEREDGGENPRWLTVYRVLDEPIKEPKEFTPNPANFVLEVLKRQKK